MSIKVLIVTSKVTYIPDNYLNLLDNLLNFCNQRIAGVLLLDNLNSGLFKSIAGIWYSGGKNLAGALVKNIWQLKDRRREKLCRQRGVPLWNALSINDPSTVDLIKTNSIDVIINIRTRFIYRAEVLRAPRLGCLNVHHGLLPHYRGLMCDLWALSEGREAGFTVHWMDKKIDAGAIVKRVVVNDGRENDYINYLRRAEAMEVRVLMEIIDGLENGRIVPGIGDTNCCENMIYTRNPRPSDVAGMRENGLIL